VALKEWPSGKTAEQIRNELQAEGYASCPTPPEARRADAGASAPAPPPPSLDTYGHSGTGVRRGPLSRQQKRCFQRLKSLMHFWVSHGFQIRWVTLTTRDSVQNKKLAYHHKRLRQRIASVHGFEGIQFVQVRARGDKNPTLQHLHIFWAWKGERSFFVPQQWLSDEWKRIHGAWIVDIQEVRGSRDDVGRVSRYFVTQYCTEQRALCRLSWSWWELPVGLARGWESVKRLGRLGFLDGWRVSHTAPWKDLKERVRTTAHIPSYHYEYLFTMPELVTAWEHLLEFGEGFLGGTLLEFRGRDVVEVF
jgi:hypothetical protein